MKFKKNNLSILKNKFNYTNFKAYANDYKVMNGKRGDPIPHYYYKNRWQSFHSIYNPGKERIEEISEFNIIIGIAGLYHIKNIINKDIKLVVIEPNKDYLNFLIENYDLSLLGDDKIIRLFTSDNLNDFILFMKNNYSPYIDGNISIITHQRSYKFFQTLFQEWIKVSLKLKKEWSEELNIQRMFGKKWFKNSLINLINIKSINISLSFKKAMIIAAGPGLERKVDEIRKLSEKYKIIAVDTAVQYLIKNNIIPDFVFTIDPQIICYHHYISKIPDSTILISDIAAHPVIKRNVKNLFYISTSNPINRQLCPDLQVIDTGMGNVTGSAVDFAIKSGADEIILFGADYSFPFHGKVYPNDTYIFNYYKTFSNRINPLSHNLYELYFDESYPVNIQGKKRYTTRRMEQYKLKLNNHVMKCGFKILKDENSKTILKKQNNISYLDSKCIMEKIKTKKMINNYLKNIQKLDIDHLLKSINSNKIEENDLHLLSTLFPVSADFDKEESPKQRLIMAREWILKTITEVSKT